MAEKIKLLLLLCLIGPWARSVPPSDELVTQAERSAWKTTGRLNEVAQLCRAFSEAYPRKVKCEVFGKSPEGRSLFALVVADPLEEAVAAKRPVILFQGGIHAGEIDGKDAGFLFVRELLQEKLLPGALKKVTLVFVPVFNVDGHERFGRNNRPNQNGPAEMGWRTTAQNLNLNRDYTKAEAPEMAAMLELLNRWDPFLYVDLHVTDGAQFQSDVSVSIEPANVGGQDSIRRWGKSIRDEVMKRLESKKHLPVPFYPDFIKDDDPSIGFEVLPSTLRFSTGYWSARGRIGILVETHSWKDYATRVRCTHDTLQALVELAAQDGEKWRAAASKADAATSKLAGKEVVLEWEAAKKSETISFPGYVYRKELSAVSGGVKIVYDPSRPQTWKVPLFAEAVPKRTVRAPKKGYLVLAGQAKLMGEKLKRHGIRFETWNESRPLQMVSVFRAVDPTFAKTPFEGRTRLEVTGEWREENRSLPAGSLFVPIDQPRAPLLVALLEPQAPDSFLAWGFFNAWFEQKEYMEGYLAEQVADEMLAKHPAWKEEFLAKLASDAEFARDPKKRLDFFYRRHASWDERYNLYPVFRME